MAEQHGSPCFLAAGQHVASPTWCLQAFGRSALMYASEIGHTAVVKMLLDKGADVDLQDKVR
jgi:hypothetical protein